MTGVGDLLARFRPAGAPGGATAAGVPADRGADLKVELAPVFAALAATHRECRELRRAAEAAAADTVAGAHGRARATLARARVDAEADGARAAAQTRAEGEAAVADIAEAAVRDVAGVLQRADELMPVLVDRLVDRVLADIALATGTADGEGAGDG